MWMQNSKFDDLSFGMTIDLTKIHCFSKSPLSDSALEDWLSKSTYWAQLENKAIEELQSIILSPL